MADQGAADWGNLQTVYGLEQGDINSFKQAGYTADQASQLLGLSSGVQGQGGSRYQQHSSAGVNALPTIGGSGLTPQMLSQMAQIFAPQGQQQAPTQQPAPPAPTQQYQGPGSQPTWATGGQPSPTQQAQQVTGSQPAANFASPASGGGQQTGGVGGGGSGGNQQTPGPRNYPVIGVDPNQPYVNLGAAALGQNAFYPPQPGAGAGAGNTQDPSQQGFQGGGGLTIGGISSTPPITTSSGVVPRAPEGPWTHTPSLFMKAPTPQPTAWGGFTPQAPATGMAYQPGQSWATPPPAPTLNLQGVPSAMSGGAPSEGSIGTFAAAHNSALADAGQALFAHFGGDPSSASPADIAHFHTQLTGAISGSISPGATALQTGASGGKEPVKMQSGGLVPEIPRGLLGGGITPKTQSKYYSDSSQADPQGTQPDRPRREVSGSSTGGQTSAQDYADWANQGGLGGSAGAVRDAQGNLVTSSGALTAQAGAGAGATMMPGGGIRDASGNVYDSSANLAAQDVGGASATMPGAGGAGAGAAGASGAASAIGSIGSAVAKAAQTYADSIKGWQMQKSAIPNPDDFRKQPQINLQQPGVV